MGRKRGSASGAKQPDEQKETCLEWFTRRYEEEGQPEDDFYLTDEALEAFSWHTRPDSLVTETRGKVAVNMVASLVDTPPPSNLMSLVHINMHSKVINQTSIRQLVRLFMNADGLPELIVKDNWKDSVHAVRALLGVPKRFRGDVSVRSLSPMEQRRLAQEVEAERQGFVAAPTTRRSSELRTAKRSEVGPSEPDYTQKSQPARRSTVAGMPDSTSGDTTSPPPSAPPMLDGRSPKRVREDICQGKAEDMCEAAEALATFSQLGPKH